MLLRSATPAVLLLVTACTAADTDPKFALFPADLDLPVVGLRDGSPPWSTLSVLNQSYFPVHVSAVELSGAGGPFLELQVPGGANGVDVGVRDSLAISVRVRPGTPGERSGWSSGTYDATLKFLTSGTGAVDAATGAIDRTQIKTEQHVVEVAFKLSCDLDRDGYDDETCSGGADCDDAIRAVSPEATELCDGIDNDCDGDEDEEEPGGCTEPG